MRAFALLLVGTALAATVASGGEEHWARVLWAAAFGIAACRGTRWFWWLLVAVNVLGLVVEPFYLEDWWLSMPLGLLGLALLLAPDSRRYVFGHEP